MRIKIISVGQAKRTSTFCAMFDTYSKRMQWHLDTVELDARKNITSAQQEPLILNAIPDGYYVFALDEIGKTLSSPAFAKKLNVISQDFSPNICFIIGGADGLTGVVRKRADYLLSFGKQTWPHQMVRVMLMEQIYRAQQILSGHPYHRD